MCASLVKKKPRQHPVSRQLSYAAGMESIGTKFRSNKKMVLLLGYNLQARVEFAYFQYKRPAG